MGSSKISFGHSSRSRLGGTRPWRFESPDPASVSKEASLQGGFSSSHAAVRVSASSSPARFGCSDLSPIAPSEFGRLHLPRLPTSIRLFGLAPSPPDCGPNLSLPRLDQIAGCAPVRRITVTSYRTARWTSTPAHGRTHGSVRCPAIGTLDPIHTDCYRRTAANTPAELWRRCAAGSLDGQAVGASPPSQSVA